MSSSSSSSSRKSKFSSANTIISTIGSIAAAAMIVRSVARDYLPREYRDYLHLGVQRFINKFSTHLTLVIYESEGFNDNEIYTATQLYLASRISSNIHRLKVTKNPNETQINLEMEINEEFIDIFDGVTFTWCLVSKNRATREFYNFDDSGNRSSRTDLRSLELTFHRKHKDCALNSYLPFIINSAKDNKLQQKTVKIFTVERKQNYRRYEGESDKRLGQLTDIKSNSELRRLLLTDIKSNSELRRLLVATTNRSILVVEDIDCSVELHDRLDVEAAKALLAQKNKHQGFLNFIDGLWSSCGDERIIIFTTNRKDKLDPALLRPGRMDVHIHMSYCTLCGFKLLASNYLNITQHNLFEEIENLISQVAITPAEVAEQLLKDDDPNIALSCLIEFFDVKRKENEEAKAKAEEQIMVARENEKKQQEDANGSTN
nr:AAA-ATPase At3g50940-like [Tanacetum cinerariifolium]